MKKKWLFSFLAMVVLQLGLVLPLYAADYDVSNIALTPGEDASELNFAWITTEDGTGECAVQIAKKSTGFKKSAIYAIYTGTKAEADDEAADYYYCEATVAGLKNQTDYIYRLGDNEGNWTDSYDYSTRNKNRYGFVFVGDPQIGSTRGGIESDIAGWTNTLSLINKKFPETAFILSGGDQIQNPGNEDEWDGFFSPAELTSIPIAPTPAAHDELGVGRPEGLPTSNALDYHFNLPNETERLKMWGDANECPTYPCRCPPPNRPQEDDDGDGVCGPCDSCPDTPAGAEVGKMGCDEGQTPCEPAYDGMALSTGDYYFTYGNVLYMMLNTDQQIGSYPAINPMDCSEHQAFMEEAIAANPHANWKIVMWHYSIYSGGSHAEDDIVLALRKAMVPVLDALDIDVVLMGHDHYLSKSHQMLGDVAQTEQIISNKGEFINPTGTQYFTQTSSSGSKYYRSGGGYPKYLAFEDQPLNADSKKAPSFSYVTVDANSLIISTFRTDTLQLIDTYAIKKVGQ